MHANAGLAFGLSFVVTSLAFSAVIFANLVGERGWAFAAGVAAMFVMIIAGLHLAGWLYYILQPSLSVEVADGQKSSPAIDRQYWSAIKDGVALQAIFGGMLFALMLDGGHLFEFFRVAFICHWLAILVIIARRPHSPTQIDLFCNRWGIVFTFFATGFMAPTVWSIIGESHMSGWERMSSD
jgi:hypothetical protein